MALTRPSRWTTRALGFMLSALLLSAAPAAAGSPTPPPAPGHTGTIGTYTYTDASDNPAGRCTWGRIIDNVEYNQLTHQGSRAPQMRAAAGRSSQKVAWRIVIQGWETATNRWVIYRKTSWSSRTATPTKAPAFAAKQKAIASDTDGDTYGSWRPRVEMRWYGRDGTTVTGRAWTWPLHYRYHDEGYPDWNVDADDCGTTWG